MTNVGSGEEGEWGIWGGAKRRGKEEGTRRRNNVFEEVEVGWGEYTIWGIYDTIEIYYVLHAFKQLLIIFFLLNFVYLVENVKVFVHNHSAFTQAKDHTFLAQQGPKKNTRQQSQWGGVWTSCMPTKKWVELAVSGSELICAWTTLVAIPLLLQQL